MQIPNRYAKPCSVCRTRVEVGHGFANNGQGPWQTFCRLHAPDQIVAKAAPVTERKLTKEGFVITPFEQDNLPLLRSFPGARWDKANRHWTVSLADQDRIQVLEVADRLGLDVDPILRNLADADHADFSNLPHDLLPFQKRGVAWLSRRDRALLGDDMGLGKTIQILVALGKEDRVLIVCPSSLKYNWARECEKWRPDFSVRVLSAADRKTGGFPVPRPGEVVVLNYDILPKWLIEDPEAEGVKLPPGVDRLKGITLVVDEAHFCANYKAQRSKKVKHLGKLVSRVWFATGTPLTTSPGNLWNILDAAGLAEEAFGHLGIFRRLFNARKKSSFGGTVWGQPDASVPERLRRVSLRRIRTEVLADLPKKTYQTLEVNDIPAKLQGQLNQVWDDQGEWLEVGGALPDFSEFSRIKAELAAAKIPALLEQVQEHEDQGVPLIVFSDHIAPVDAVGQRDGWAVIKGGVKDEDRQSIVDAFQAGQLKGIAITIGAGGFGLNLTRAWKILFNDLNWTPSANYQAEDRICRIGQVSKTCQITRLVIKHPLEQHIHRLIVEKTELFAASIDAQVTVAAPAAVNGNGQAVQGETQAEYDARLEAARLAAEAALQQAEEDARANAVARAKSKVEDILAHARSNGNGRVEKPIDATRAQAIRDAVRFLSGVCDGAVLRDGQGFNKADTFRGKTLALAGLQTETELRCAEYIIWKYRGQIESLFPAVYS